MSLSTRGELLALWFSTWEVHVVDLRPHRNQRQYIIKLDGNMSSREDSLASNFWNCTCVEPFRYGEQEGFVLAVEYVRSLDLTT
ncbi:hypothetical protein DL93DRAFT_2084232 [Clavulina sp. PMI_390]|nr:hypothetical protein DL93DRAFT_2084232 [Clavulina sp. PMI_390]